MSVQESRDQEGTPKAGPKTPGRKPGEDYGPKAHRPFPEQMPDEIIDVPLAGECSDCGGDAREDHIEQEFQVEIPRLAPRLSVGPSCGSRYRED